MMQNATEKNIDKKFQKLMDKTLKLQNQVTKLMVSSAINAAELKMAYTQEFIKNVEAANNLDNK